MGGGRKTNSPTCSGACIVKTSQTLSRFPCWTARLEQLTRGLGARCHCVQRNNNSAAFRSHQICLSLLECGTELIPSCTCRGNLKNEGSQGDVPVGCLTSYQIICLLYCGAPSDKCLVWVCTQRESGEICIR